MHFFKPQTKQIKLSITAGYSEILGGINLGIAFGRAVMHQFGSRAKSWWWLGGKPPGGSNCTLVRDLSKLFKQDVFSTRFPLSILTEPMFIWCRYLIPNNWKQTNIWIRLLQNLLITDNARIFWKVYFWAGNLPI